MANRWGLRFLGLFLVVSTGCVDPGTGPTPPPPPGNRPPVIVIDGPTEVAKGTTVRFDASNTTDPEDDALEFFWEENEGNPANNFFDGVALNEPRIQMLVDVVGTFTYTLTAKDSVGNLSSSPVTLTVTEKPGAAPVISGVKINGILFNFASNPTPTAFTTSSEPMTFLAVGTDVDTATGKLIAKFSAPIANGSYMTPTMADDADGFRTVSAQVSLADPEGHTSDTKTFYIRIVPKATSDLKARAVYVNCAVAGPGTGTAADPYQSIQTAFNAASAIPVLYRRDLYIASGTCTQSVQVSFKDVNVYGLFEPANGWTRRTDIGTSETYRFQSPTILTNPNAESLLYTAPVTGNGGLVIDGITFKLAGNNYFGIDLTSPTTENERLTIQNSEFIGTAVTSSNFKVGGGIRIKQGPSTDSNNPIDGAMIRRNLFAVGAADNGSRFQVWATHKDNYVSGSRKKQFYSNVFYGGIGYSEPYSCVGAQKPFAFCLFMTDGDSAIVNSNWNIAARNLFWIRSGNASFDSTVLSAGGGRLKAIGNIFRNVGATHPVRFIHGRNWDGAIIGFFSYNAFPPYSSAVTYVDSAPNSFNCIADIGSGMQLGKDPGTGCGNWAATTLANTFGSFNSTGLTSSLVYPWRLSGAELNDVVSTSGDFLAAAMWDFDGRYGAGNDVGPIGSKEFNIGPFETAAPNP